MKRIVSLLLSLVLLLSITAGIDLSAYAIGAGGFDYLDPLSDEYVIDKTANQFDSWEAYVSVESMKKWAKDIYSMPGIGETNIIDKYAKKIGVVKDDGKPNTSLTEYERIARIYQYMALACTYDAEGGTLVEESFIVRTGYCQTFSWLVNALCLRAGIECWSVDSSGASHSWNFVKIDGLYYTIDRAGWKFLDNPNTLIGLWKTYSSEVRSADQKTFYGMDGTSGLEEWLSKVGNGKLASSAYPKRAFEGANGDSSTLRNPTLGLATPSVISTTATSEGVIVKFKGVANADWYDIYVAQVDGEVTNPYDQDYVTGKGIVNKPYSGTWLYYKGANGGQPFQFKRAATVHSIDKNESGQYQCFLENTNKHGAIIYVVAKNVNGKCSFVDTTLNNATIDKLMEQISTEYVKEIQYGTDKNTKKAIEDFVIAKIKSANYAIYKSNAKHLATNGNHAYTKIKAIRTAGAGTQGADLYECKNCLQRKMVYTAAKSLSTPKLSSVSNVVAGVKVSWGKVSGAAKYRVFYKANGEKTWHKAGDTTSTSYTWTKAKNNTKYSFTVRCINSNGEYVSSYDSTGKSITFLSAPTVKVSNVVAGVKVNWGKVSGAVNYVVFRKTPGGTYKRLGTTTGTSFTDKTAKNNTKYVYAVRCATKDGKTYTSSYNPGKSITFLSAPTVKVSNVVAGVKISWNKVSGAVNYKVYRKTPGGSYKAIGTTTSTSFTDKTAKNNTKYIYAVRCVTKDGKTTTSSYNPGKSITFLSAPKVTVSKASNGVQVKWGKVTGAVNYKVYRKTSGGSYKAIGTTTSTSYVDKTAKKGVKYVYAVRCVSKNGKTTTSSYNAGKSITR